MKLILPLSATLLLALSRANQFDKQFEHLKTTTSRQHQLEAIGGLFQRVIGNRSTDFITNIDQNLGPPNRDTFHIELIANGKVQIVGSSAIAVAAGLNHYLKYHCHQQISWESHDDVYLPLELPHVNFTKTSNDRFRYYQNVCTTSYSFVWWNWSKWEQHIDWMVLNSYNLVLAFTGQEAIWERVYLMHNLTRADIDEHFAGPAFLSWNRMGNVRGWAGPLSRSWQNDSMALQKLIVKRMRQFGILTVMPAFAGHLPRAFKRIYPNTSMYKMETWNKFNDSYCCPYLLDPTEPLFKQIGKEFIEETTAEYGTDHIYNCDTFNEMQPFTTNETYLSTIGKSIYASMTDVDSKALWLMQNWMFVHEVIYWDLARAKALLTSVPPGKMIILDLQSEQFPQYGRLENYFGQPYIWCMLHNFGGTLGLFGSVDIINKRVFEARAEPNSTLVGTGLTPEGINQNYVVYDLMSEIAWRDGPADLSDWIRSYVRRRYGRDDNEAVKAWRLLMRSVYNYSGLTKMRGKYAFNKSPTTNLKTWTWYNSSDVFDAWDLLLRASDALQSREAYLHDVVDVTRQVLQVLGDEYYNQMITAFKSRHQCNFNRAAEHFLSLFPYMERILASNRAFLLGTWLESAKNLAQNEQDKVLFEYNARNQITLWGPKAEIKDYANKQWSGVVRNFFEPRWSLFIQLLNQSLIDQKPFRESQARQDVFLRVEEPFTFDQKTYATQPRGNTINIAKKIHKRWLHSEHVRIARSNTRYVINIVRV